MYNVELPVRNYPFGVTQTFEDYWIPTKQIDDTIIITSKEPDKVLE